MKVVIKIDDISKLNELQMLLSDMKIYWILYDGCSKYVSDKLRNNEIEALKTNLQRRDCWIFINNEKMDLSYSSQLVNKLLNHKNYKYYDVNTFLRYYKLKELNEKYNYKM